MSKPAVTALPEIPEQGERNQYLSLAGGLVIFTEEGLRVYRELLADVDLPAARLSRVKSQYDLQGLHTLILALRTKQAARRLQAKGSRSFALSTVGATVWLVLRGRFREGLNLWTRRP